MDCLDRIERYVADGREAFMDSDLIQDGVLRRLHTMAESTQRISDVVKSNHPEVPWREISGFRNVVVHGYLSVDLIQIWDIVENDLATAPGPDRKDLELDQRRRAVTQSALRSYLADRRTRWR